MMRSEVSHVVRTLRAAGCVYAEDEARLIASAAHDRTELDTMVARRAGGEPLEYVLGWAEFCGLRIVVAPGVFVPRRRTEFLVHEALALLRPGAIVVDLCCGSGAVGAALGSSVKAIVLHATDIDPVAVRCARRNIGESGRVYEGDLFGPLPAGLKERVDLLVVNAPYVPTAQIRLMPAEARLYEARVTLDGGHDGLEIQRRISSHAPAWLRPGGHVVVETSARQSSGTAQMLSRNGFDTRIARDEELDATVVIGTLGRRAATPSIS